MNFIATSTFLKENNIDISTEKMKLLAIENKCRKNIENLQIFRFEENDLNNIVFKENLSCLLFEDENYVLYSLYMMDIYHNNEYTGIVKIGISNDPEDRLYHLNRNWKKENISFKLKLVSSKQRKDMREFEQSIHTCLEFLGKQYIPLKKLDGFSEFFYYEKWMDNLINPA